MAKIIMIVLLYLHLFGDIFKTNCLKCHNNQDLTIFIKAYTLKYSSKEKIKKGLYKFLRNPTSNIPLMSYNFIVKRGYKQDSLLTDKELKKAINIYYEKYNMAKMIR